MFSCFPPEIYLSAKGCPRPKWPKPPVFRDFLPLGVRSVKTENLKTLRNFGEKLLGRPDFPPKVPLAPGNCIFIFSARAQNLSKCPRPKQAKIPLNHRFSAVGVRPGKKFPPRKLQKTIPNSVATLFFAKSAPSTGKLRFSVSVPGPEFLQVPAAQNGPNYH